MLKVEAVLRESGERDSLFAVEVKVKVKSSERVADALHCYEFVDRILLQFFEIE